jgi:hypothetical protein
MTEIPQLYLRRCNGLPVDGIVVTRATVASVIALASVSIIDARGNLETGLSVRLAAGRPWEVEPGGTTERTFTYTPIA